MSGNRMLRCIDKINRFALVKEVARFIVNGARIFNFADRSMILRTPRGRALAVALMAGLGLSACVSSGKQMAANTTPLTSPILAMAPEPGLAEPPALDAQLTGQQLPREAFQRTEVDYATKEVPGTIIIDSKAKFLYLVEENGKAMRYGVGVGRQGFGWSGSVNVGSKQEWPRWFPPKEMIAREHARGHMIPDMMEGQIGNPLGARAMYLVDDKGKDTLFRIHGTFEPNTVGTNASSGCFRMANFDVIDLYDRVQVGAKVVVL